MIRCGSPYSLLPSDLTAMTIIKIRVRNKSCLIDFSTGGLFGHALHCIFPVISRQTSVTEQASEHVRMNQTEYIIGQRIRFVPASDKLCLVSNEEISVTLTPACNRLVRASQSSCRARSGRHRPSVVSAFTSVTACILAESLKYPIHQRLQPLC